MRPMLGDIEFETVQRIESGEGQALVRHEVPALEGDFFERLGRRGTRVSLTGVVSGPGVAERLAELRAQVRAAAPVAFLSDVATASRLRQVMVERLDAREVAGKPQRFEVTLVLREYTVPPSTEEEEPPEPPPDPLPAQQIDAGTGTLVVEVVAQTADGTPDDGFAYAQVQVKASGTGADGEAFSRLLSDRQANVWTGADLPAVQLDVEATVASPVLTAAAQAALRPGETVTLRLVLAVVSSTAQALRVHFRFDSAFVEPCMRPVLKAAEQRLLQPGSQEKVLVVGHTDKVGSASYNQSLSERRARAVAAFLVAGRDPAAAHAEWTALRQPRPAGQLPSVHDSWGLREAQHMLQDLDFYPGAIDGETGPLTLDAIRAYRCHEGLPPGTQMDPAVWDALIADYLAKDALAVPADRFLANARDGCDGGRLTFLGCGEEQPLPQPQPTRGTAHRPYRRAEILFLEVDRLPCDVREPATFQLPPPVGAAARTWCLDPSGSGDRTCFASRDCANAGNRVCIRDLDAGSLAQVEGRILRDDGTPFAGKRFVLLAPDGTVRQVESSSGEPQPARTAGDGSFRFPDLPVGVYALEVREAVLARLDGAPEESIRGRTVCKELRQAGDRLDVVISSAPVLREIELKVVAHRMTALHPTTRQMRTCPDPLDPNRSHSQATRHDAAAVRRFFDRVNQIWSQARIRFRPVAEVAEVFADNSQCEILTQELATILDLCNYPNFVNVYFFGDLEGQVDAGVYVAALVGDPRGHVDGVGISDRHDFTVFQPPVIRQLSDAESEQVLAHELGHYLGLDHVTGSDRLMLAGTFGGQNRQLVDSEVSLARASCNAHLECAVLGLDVQGAVRLGAQGSQVFLTPVGAAPVRVEAVIPAPLLTVGTLQLTGGQPGASPTQRTVDTTSSGSTTVHAVYTSNPGSGAATCLPAAGGPAAVPLQVTRAVVRVVTFDLELVPGPGVVQVAPGTVVTARDTTPGSRVTLQARVRPAPHCVPSDPPMVTWSGGEAAADPLRRIVSRLTVGRTRVTATLTGTGASASIDVFVVRVTLDVDADRDGVVEEDAPGKDTWAFGPGARGAVLLCNNDNDDHGAGDSEIDHENERVDGAGDVSDLARLMVRAPGALPAGTRLELTSPQRNLIRVFQPRAAAGTGLIGPAPLPGTATVAPPASGDLELGVEGLRYPGPGFVDGQVTLELRLRGPGGVLASDRVVMRVAPWLMPSHLGVSQEIHVVETTDNAAFVSRLAAIATAAGLPLRRTSNVDRWMQDTMEIGFSRMPGKTIHAVFKSPRRRGLAGYARNDVLAADVGYFEEGTAANTFDSHGNLEVSPPVTVGSREFKLGRIYFGSGRLGARFNAAVQRFLEGQRVQAPFAIDTGWLMVGHVDEVMSLVPSRRGKGFKLLIGDTREALRILRTLAAAGHGARRMFSGTSEAVSVADLLTDLGRTTPGSLGWANDHCQRRLDGDAAAGFDGVERRMRQELGLVDDDIVRVPALFVENPRSPRRTALGGDPEFDALIPAMVNMLVITASTFAGHRLVIPAPRGPSIGGSEPFEQDLRSKLATEGYGAGQLLFVDVFDTYHLLQGEIHCGTNSKRTADTTPWWEQTDF